MTADQLFWICLTLVVYAFVGYPFMTVLLARYFGTSPRRRVEFPPITIVVAARNEAPRIVARLRNLLDSDYPDNRLSVLLVDDGSDDGTADAALLLKDARVQLLRLPLPVGKAAALNAGMAQVHTPLTAFADARQRFEKGTLAALVAPFVEPAVGVVSGELHTRSEGTLGHAVAAEGTYARIERSLRAAEARMGWAHAASGAVYAIRTTIFRPLPPGLVLDDVYTPLQALRQGMRIWVARDAIAFDAPGANLRQEFRRKLRTLTGNWQLIAAQPWLLNPGVNPAFFAWMSHKLVRLIAPWALLGALLSAAFAEGALPRAAFWIQLIAYATAAASIFLPHLMRRIPFAATAGSFVALNAAALLSLPVYLGQPDLARLWKA